MAQSDRESVDGESASIERVSDALPHRRGTRTFGGRLGDAEVWLLVDAPRWQVIGGLAAAVFFATVAVGAFGPASVREYLLGGTSVANAYIELQPGVITAITVVLGINQLVLSPEFGSIGRQRERLEDVLSHRRDVEERAAVATAPIDPAGILRTITDATRTRSRNLADATAASDDSDLDKAVRSLESRLRAELEPVWRALENQSFSEISFVGATIHYDASRHVRRIREIRRTYPEALTFEQQRALDELLAALNEFTVAREYFRTRYLQSEFIRFSRVLLFVGFPAVVVAHFAVGVIGPGVLPGSTLGIRNLLWFEAGTFTVTMLPVAVIVGYVARIVTLAETGIFIGPIEETELK